MSFTDDDGSPVFINQGGPPNALTTQQRRIEISRDRPWRTRFRTTMASFKGVPFHIEHQSRSSGRRIVEHEYPKRDLPWSEDMGRHSIRYTITGYVIEYDLGQEFSTDYQNSKNRLIEKLEEPEPGVLIDPYMPTVKHLGYGTKDAVLLFQCERYSVSETRQQGGYATFEMAFVEAGTAALTTIYEYAEQKVKEAADQLAKEASEAYNDELAERMMIESGAQQPADTFDDRFQFPTSFDDRFSIGIGEIEIK